jgi:hypothetical protein
MLSAFGTTPMRVVRIIPGLRATNSPNIPWVNPAIPTLEFEISLKRAPFQGYSHSYSHSKNWKVLLLVEESHFDLNLFFMNTLLGWYGCHILMHALVHCQKPLNVMNEGLNSTLGNTCPSHVWAQSNFAKSLALALF